jgi:DnaJ domain
MKTSTGKVDWRVRFGSRTSKSSGPRQLARACDHPGCSLEGEYRAPRDRDRLEQYYWFCLDHVRAYNAGWDYYAGMSTLQIELEVRSDTTWQRPTWPMGGSAKVGQSKVHKFYDAFGILDEDAGPAPSSPRPRRNFEESSAMHVLGISDPLTLLDLKARYKELVKQYHPDANGGDPQSEEKFKTINNAYRILLITFDTTS